MTVAVLVNAHSRHGSEALGAKIRAILPQASVRVTRSLEDARDFVREELVARHAQRQPLAEVIGDQSQGQVQTGGQAGAGPDITVADEDRVGIHLDLRVLVSELLRGGPMCGDTTAFEQACRSQDMRAHAHGRNGPSRWRNPSGPTGGSRPRPG